MTTRTVPEAPCPSCGNPVPYAAVSSQPSRTADEKPSEDRIRRNPAKDAGKLEQGEASSGPAEREHAQPKVKQNNKSKKK